MLKFRKVKNTDDADLISKIRKGFFQKYRNNFAGTGAANQRPASLFLFQNIKRNGPRAPLPIARTRTGLHPGLSVLSQSCAAVPPLNSKNNSLRIRFSNGMVFYFGPGQSSRSRLKTVRQTRRKNLMHRLPNPSADGNMGGQPNETSRAKHSTLAIIVSNCALGSQRKQIKGFTYVYAPLSLFHFSVPYRICRPPLAKLRRFR